VGTAAEAGRYGDGMIVQARPRPRTRPLAAIAALAAAALLVAGCGSDSTGVEGTTDTVATGTFPEAATIITAPTAPATTTTAGPKTITIVVENAAPKGGIMRATVAKGDNVVFVVHSDVADEIHLHGYNLSTDVAAGGVGRIRFVATVPGRFEAELEQRGVQIADLTVTP
jgi:archaellum component FlaG (FlaF/FlaG flagellin family)